MASIGTELLAIVTAPLLGDCKIVSLHEAVLKYEFIQ